MRLYENTREMQENLKNSVDIETELRLVDKQDFIKNKLDNLVYNVRFNTNKHIRGICKWILWEVCRQNNIYPASIYELYMARARAEIGKFTVPAMNLRTLTYEMARAVIRAVNKINAGAFIFEIAKSEIGYTVQPPSEYTAVCLAAALKEGFEGPLFIQADHFQLKEASYKEDPVKAVDDIKELISRAIAGGFYNIDIDSSTLVDLDRSDVLSQQEDNFKVCAELTKYIRTLEPEGINISVGGEIGEVGGKNSTPEELEAFMTGYKKEIGQDITGISKISVQTGSSHGGVVLPDGSIAEVKIDFDTLKTLSREAKEKYHMAGAVQHGASTLPKEAFGKFPEVECAEIHLATNFQNIVYDSKYFPEDLRKEIYEYIKENFTSEKKENQTEEQFIYKLRKKALGPFKKNIVNLPDDVKNEISRELEEEFDFLFQKLNIAETKKYVKEYVSINKIKKDKGEFSQEFIKDAEALEGAD